jgi:hypothetical protein
MCVSEETLTNQRFPASGMGAVETAEGREMEVEVAGDLLVAGGKQQVLLGEALVPNREGATGESYLCWCFLRPTQEEQGGV